MCLLHFGFREARHEVALRDEAAVEREAITAGRVELLRAQPELDRGRGAALSADHARGTAAGTVAQCARLEQYDAPDPGFGEQDGGPRTDRPPTDDHHIGAV